MTRTWQGVILALVVFGANSFGVTVTETEGFTHPDTEVTFVSGRLLLPSKGLWQLDAAVPVKGGLRQLVLKAPASAIPQGQSQRLKLENQRRLPNRGRSSLYQFHRRALDFALKNKGVPPRTVAELAGEGRRNKWIEQQFSRNPYGKDAGETKPGPHYAILPTTTFALADSQKRGALPTNHDPYIVELHPVFDDGKHWVLYTDRKMVRTDIDRALMAKHGLKIDPYLPDPNAPPPPVSKELEYAVYAIDVAAAPCTFALVNLATGEKAPGSWNTAKAQQGDEAMATEWATLRMRRWARYMVNGGDAPILRHWGRILMAQYGAKAPVVEDQNRRRGRRRQGAQTSAFGVLGGRAAMQETLQMQLLNMTRKTEGPGVPVADIAGVEVKSHPFKEMLDGKPGGRLPLADAVPLDRFALFIRRPGSLLPMLGQGGKFMARVGTSATGRSLRYDLEGRYLRRLGLDRAWLEQLLKSGFVTEMVLVLPDLFVVDGTEVTAISRSPQAALLKPLLAMAGVKDLSPGKVAAVRLPGGNMCYWSLMDDLVIVSTNREEIDRALGAKAGRTPSLGKSDEFRYMLTKLAPTSRTRMFAYFSDPFIRRLVGPEVKIGQLRRVKERARLEGLTAAALLFRADGHEVPPTIDLLLDSRYLPDYAAWDGLSLDDDMRAVSETHGRLGELASVSSHPILLATAGEAEAYKQYVQAYTRFWRRFFDPIAVRLDDTEDGGLTVETFILPLLDNSMYNNVRQVIGSGKEKGGLKVPQLKPEPVLLASLNLTEKVWRDVLGDMFRRRGTPLAFSAALDQLGPAVHVALHDSDPIIAFGSGDMLGLGGQVGGRRSEMIAIPLFISLLTRPLTIAVELADPKPVRTFLEMGALKSMIPWQREMGSEVSWYQMGDKDAWVLGMGVFGIGIRFRFQIQDNYLLISNLPWMERSQVAGTEPAALRALEVRLRPDLVEAQLAAMFTAAHERERMAAIGGMGYVVPFLEAGVSMEQSAAEHQRLLGFTPVHPAPGKWMVQDGQLASSVYGRHDRPRQPEYQKGSGPFGVLQGVADLRLSLQLEDDGLRTRVRWTYTK